MGITASSPISKVPVNLGAAEPANHLHAMLSHDWGVDGANHARVKEVNNILKSMGVRTWFDEEMLKRNIKEEMAEGINMSTWVVAFITKRYIEKIASKNMQVVAVLLCLLFLTSHAL